MVKSLLDEEQAPQLMTELRTLTGFPARVTLENPAAAERTVRIPGLIRRVSATGITVDLLFPMTVPYTGAPVVLEVISRTALLQCFTVIQHTDSPQCVHLRLPDELHSVQRRRSPRVEVILLATIAEHLGCGNCIPVKVNNLSIGGAAIQIHRPMDVGSPVTLNLSATGLSPAEVSARVVRCTPTPSGAWVAGLAFGDLTPEQGQQLNQFIVHTLGNETVQ